jgi:hypothetical protein
VVVGSPRTPILVVFIAPWFSIEPAVVLGSPGTLFFGAVNEPVAGIVVVEPVEPMLPGDLRDHRTRRRPRPRRTHRGDVSR